MSEKMTRILLRKRFDSAKPDGTEEEFESFYTMWQERIQESFDEWASALSKEFYPDVPPVDLSFSTYLKKMVKDWKQSDALNRKCDQCGEWLSVCSWGYPVYRHPNLEPLFPNPYGVPKYRTMGCVIGPGDDRKNWWCDQCESFFE